MIHPQELLAAYVDGDLPPDEREEVERHLASCAPCREGVELARAARSALRTLPEVPVPVGVTGPLLRRAGSGGRWGRAGRWAGAAAAAATVVAVLALALPELGQPPGSPERLSAPAADAGGADAWASWRAPVLERQARDYRPEDLAVLAEEPRHAMASADGESVAQRPSEREALACVAAGSDLTPEDRIVRLIEARFQGKPAYLVVAHRGPGAGQPPTKVVIWVISTQSCEPLSFSQGRLP
ncbi:MAG TPA: zf-HC2 domain-containing protein [Actinomycetota bacterium]|nr:zf-HC2 domain-containing protein [Actinomycetota bacterium]